MKKYYFTDVFVKTIRAIFYATSSPMPEWRYMETPKTVKYKTFFGLITKTKTLSPGYYYKDSDEPLGNIGIELFHIGEDVYTKPRIKMSYQYAGSNRPRKLELTYDTDEEMMEVFNGISERLNLTEY